MGIFTTNNQTSTLRNKIKQTNEHNFWLHVLSYKYFALSKIKDRHEEEKENPQLLKWPIPYIVFCFNSMGSRYCYVVGQEELFIFNVNTDKCI